MNGGSYSFLKGLVRIWSIATLVAPLFPLYWLYCTFYWILRQLSLTNSFEIINTPIYYLCSLSKSVWVMELKLYQLFLSRHIVYDCHY